MKNPFSSLIIILFLILLTNNALGQRKEDVIYLSNGTIIHGIILKDSSARTIRILNHAGDTWVFDRKDIDSVARKKPFEYKAIMFNQPGSEFNINAEFLMRSGKNAVGNAVVPGISMALGHRFNSYASAAAEIGVAFYDYMEVPISASLRLRTSSRALSPLILLRAGYTLPAESRPDDYDYEYRGSGGVHATIGLGVERIINENASFLFTFSYHYQELNYHLSPLNQNQWLQERDRTETYSRFRLTVGYVFK
jgi:hypothetical protein